MLEPLPSRAPDARHDTGLSQPVTAVDAEGSAVRTVVAGSVYVKVDCGRVAEVMVSGDVPYGDDDELECLHFGDTCALLIDGMKYLHFSSIGNSQV